MEGKNANWFLKYRDGEYEEISLLDCQESQRDDFGRKCGFTDEPWSRGWNREKSIMGEDAWQEFYGKDPYADKKKELKEKLNEMNSRSGVRKLSYVQGERCTQHGQGQMYAIFIRHLFRRNKKMGFYGA